MKAAKKDLNFELNLMPVFDIMSVCICFLLMTVAWIQTGSMDFAQAVGAAGQSESKSIPTVWVSLKNHDVVFTVKDVPSFPTRDFVVRGGANINWSGVEQEIATLKEKAPQLNTALISPSQKSSYDDIVRLMDSFKKTGLRDIGIQPL